MSEKIYLTQIKEVKLIVHLSTKGKKSGFGPLKIICPGKHSRNNNLNIPTRDPQYYNYETCNILSFCVSLSADFNTNII